MTRILVVTPSHAEVTDVDVTLGSLRNLIGGGYLEAISGWHPYGEWSCYIDEEGKLKSLPVNERATMLAGQSGWSGAMSDVICGTALFLGPTDDDGYDTDVPDWLVEEARSLGPVKDVSAHE